MSGGITIFEDVSDYDNWLDGTVPDHPHFERHAQIRDIVAKIKGLILSKVLDGCEKLVQNLKCQSTDILNTSIRQNPGIWKSVISGHKYGVIYLCSRSDARDAYLDVIQSSPFEVKLVNSFLLQDSTATRAINYGVQQYICSEFIETIFASKFVPPNAVAALGEYMWLRVQALPTILVFLGI